MSIPHHLLQSKAGSQQCTTKGGQFWTPIPRLRGSNLHAETQGALFWELRTALGLAQLRVTQSREDEAREILLPVFEQFTEGFATKDLRAAKALLDVLRR
jgi:predicted ATPase